MKASGNYLFHEEQSFRNSWVFYLLIATVLGVLIYQLIGMYQQLYLGKPWGDTPVSDHEFLISSVFTMVMLLVVTLILANLNLITEVRTEGFYYRFPIFINRPHEIRKEDVLRYEVGKYRPLVDFGGWGIRYRPGGRRAYNVKGNQGVKFYLKNGKMVLFGTQQPYEMKRAVDKMMNPSNL
jgi:hypothetical protein